MQKLFSMRGSAMWLTLTVALFMSLFTLLGAAQAAHASGADTWNRAIEPVTVRGVDVPHFSGASTDQIFVYREASGAWEQIPFQIDEVTASGDYTETEDGRLDADDEIVFMVGDLGDEATTPITATLPISNVWYEVTAVDPLNPAQKGWAYIVRSAALTVENTTDYADYNAAERRIEAANYEIGWATSHLGLDYMSLFGGDDILDRTKLRAKYRIWPLPSMTLTEDDLSVPELRLVKDGAVRAIVQRGEATTLAYGSLSRTETSIDLTGLPSIVTINEVRFSTDLADSVTDGTYYDENVSAGVKIDGTPDAVPETPFTQAWRQISLDDGTMIQVLDLGTPGGAFSHYYKDDSTQDANDTGDGKSFGDSGVKVTNPTVKFFSIKSVQYILPGSQANRGPEFYQVFRHPLQIDVQLQGGYRTFVPMMAKGS